MDKRNCLTSGMIVVVETIVCDNIIGEFDRFLNDTDCHLKKTYAFNSAIEECTVLKFTSIREASLDEIKEFVNLTGYNIFENPIIGPVLMRDIERFGYGSREKKESVDTEAPAAAPEPTPAPSPDPEVHHKPLPEDDRHPERPETDYKNDRRDDKLRWELLPMAEIEDIVKVYHAGAKKYKPDSWKNLDDGARRYYAACHRHLMAYVKGEKIDKETGAYHLACAAWNIIAMLYYDKHGKGFDFSNIKTDKFIEKACIVHNNKYKYPNTIYVKQDEKVEIECPIHGSFWQTPHNHLNGAGCPICRNRLNKNHICGVGINDIDGAADERSYNIWSHLIKRCYGKRKSKAYKDCSMCDEWRLYSNFKKFYDENCKDESYHLDKDILIQGNKKYSPETCIFVPVEINEVISSYDMKDKSLPLGVTMTNSGEYRVRCNIFNKEKHIGCYDNPLEAFLVYKNTKEEELKRIAEEHLKKGNIDHRVYNAIINRKILPYPYGDKRNDEFLYKIEKESIKK